MRKILFFGLFLLCSCSNELMCAQKDVNTMTEREFEFCKAMASAPTHSTTINSAR